MNIQNLLEYNNKLRPQLNEENKKYYEELLVACRAKAIIAKEAELEIQLLEILQDLITYQNQGKNFPDIFGNDINKLSDSIIKLLPKEHKTTIYHFISVYTLILIISFLLPSIFTKSIQPYLAVFSILVLILGTSLCFYLLLYKKTEKNKWFIYFTSFVLFEISLFLVTILEKLNVFPSYLTIKVSLTNNFFYIYTIFSLLSIIYIYLTFKKYYSKKL
jgi:transmembrane protein tmp6